MNLFSLERLEEAEEKFRSRQSRPEDLEVIEQLKRALAERELDMKKLVVSKDSRCFWFWSCKTRLTSWARLFESRLTLSRVSVNFCFIFSTFW